MISKNSRQAMQPNELGKANQICDLKRHDLVAVIIFMFSKYSFGIFLSHAFFIFAGKALEQRLGLELGIYERTACNFAFSLIASFALTALLSKQRHLRLLVM